MAYMGASLGDEFVFMVLTLEVFFLVRKVARKKLKQINCLC